MMSKKDYVAIAAIIKCNRNSSDDPVVRVAMCTTAVRFAAYFAGRNDRFDTGRFLTACGVGQ